MKKLLIALLLCLAPSLAWAQAPVNIGNYLFFAYGCAAYAPVPNPVRGAMCTDLTSFAQYVWNGTAFIAENNITNVGTGTLKMQVASLAGCTTAASIGATCTSAVVLPTAFADTGFYCICNGMGTAVGFPVEGTVTASAANTCTVTTVAATAVAASFATLACLAVHP